MASTSADAMRYLATVKRQSAPPRCNPFTIVLVVLALGMLFIGLTMTIIAHWPGSTSIGENPLKIAGPILLAVGGTLFIIGVILSCVLNSRERKRWEKMIMKYASTRPTMDQSSFGPGSQKPGSYDDSRGANTSNVPLLHGDDDGRRSYPGKGANNSDSFYPNKDGYPFPDGGGPGMESSYTLEDDDGVPDPVRDIKKRRPKKPGTGSNENLAGGDYDPNGPGGSGAKVTDGEDSFGDGGSQARNKKKPKVPLNDSGSMSSGGAVARPPTKPKPGIQPPASPGGSRLLVHVKAQPGATVHIHPSGSPAMAPKPAFSTYSHSTQSDETDI